MTAISKYQLPNTKTWHGSEMCTQTVCCISLFFWARKKSEVTKSLFSSLAQMLNTQCLLNFFRKLLLDALS